MSTQSSEKIVYVNKVEIGTNQSNVECRFSAMEQKVEKVLATTQDVQIMSCECLVKEANIQGKITIDLVYETPEGEIDSASSTFTFQTKLESQKCDPNLICRVDAKVIDCTIESVAENEIKYIVVVETKIVGYIQGETEIACLDESCCAKQSTAQSIELIKDANFKINQNYDFDFKTKVRKILKVDVQSICKDCESKNGYITVNGEDIISVLYVEDDVEPKLKSQSTTRPFSEEIEIGAATDSRIVECQLSTCVDSVTSTLTNSDDGAKVAIAYDICGRAFILEKKEYTVVSDVYSLTHTTLVSTNSYTCFEPDRTVFFQNKIEGTVTISEADQRIDKILENCGSRVKVLSAYTNEDEIVVQGVAKTTVIYLNDESGSILSAEVEIPFEVKQRASDINTSSMVDVCCVLDGVDVVAKRGRDILFEGEVKVRANVFNTRTDAIISNIELSEAIPPKTAAMEIYFATAGQTLWDIAKDMLEDIEVLGSLNPDLPEVMEGGEKVICYRRRAAAFDCNV